MTLASTTGSARSRTPPRGAVLCVVSPPWVSPCSGFLTTWKAGRSAFGSDAGGSNGGSETGLPRPQPLHLRPRPRSRFSAPGKMTAWSRRSTVVRRVVSSASALPLLTLARPCAACPGPWLPPARRVQPGKPACLAVAVCGASCPVPIRDRDVVAAHRSGNHSARCAQGGSWCPPLGKVRHTRTQANFSFSARHSRHCVTCGEPRARNSSRHKSHLRCARHYRTHLSAPMAPFVR
jgi:hypothetical protein